MNLLPVIIQQEEKSYYVLEGRNCDTCLTLKLASSFYLCIFESTGYKYAIKYNTRAAAEEKEECLMTAIKENRFIFLDKLITIERRPGEEWNV